MKKCRKLTVLFLAVILMLPGGTAKAATVPDPVSPSNITSVSKTNSITLKWKAASGATLYKIRRRTPSESSYTTIASVTDTSFTDTKLLAGQKYYYRVYSANSAGNSAKPDTYAVYTLPQGVPASDITFSVTSNSVVLRWKAVSDVKSYHVYRRKPSESEYKEVATTASDVLTYTDTHLKSDANYYYRIFTENEAGLSESAEVKKTRTALATVTKDEQPDDNSKVEKNDTPDGNTNTNTGGGSNSSGNGSGTGSNTSTGTNSNTNTNTNTNTTVDERETCELRYDLNGGTGNVAPQTALEGDTVSLTTERPTSTFRITLDANDGVVSQKSISVPAEFSAWCEERDGDGELYCSGSSLKVDEDMLLFAIYRATVPNLPTPTKEGSTFQGWVNDDDEVVYAGMSFYGNMELVAEWEEEPEPDPIPGGTTGKEPVDENDDDFGDDEGEEDEYEDGEGNEWNDNENDDEDGETEFEIGDTITKGGLTYEVTENEDDATVCVTGAAKGRQANISIPATIEEGDTVFRVTEIEGYAFAGNRKITSVKIGKNVKKIGECAFYRCAKLKKISIATTRLTKKSIGKQAFQKTAKKVTVSVPKSKAKLYREILRKKGISAKVKFKTQK